MGKKSSTKSGNKKNSGHKTKKPSVFKALAKQEHRSAVVTTEKKTKKENKQKVLPKRSASTQISDEFRNFDERMAGKHVRKQASSRKSVTIAPPTLVVAPPTFQFNSNLAQTTAPSQPEVEGFHGFLSAMQTPKDTVPVRVDHEARRPKAVHTKHYDGNVFAVLNDDEDQQQQQLQNQNTASFVQPATFTFATTAPTFQYQSPQQPHSAGATFLPPPITSSGVEIDPDL